MRGVVTARFRRRMRPRFGVENNNIKYLPVNNLPLLFKPHTFVFARPQPKPSGKRWYAGRRTYVRVEFGCTSIPSCLFARDPE